MFKFFTKKNIKVKQKTRKFSDELERLASAGKNGDFDFSLDYNGLSHEERLYILLINDAIRNYRAATEYDIMKYRLTSDALGIALWDMNVVSADPVNPDNTFTWSQEFRHMLGFNDERDFPNVTHSWSDRLHPEDKDRTLNAFTAHLNDYTGKTPYDIEYRLKLKNGDYRYFHAFGTTLRDKKGVPLRAAGALRDINERKLMENQLLIMSSIVHNSPNFISYKKIGGECIYINPAASALTGYTHEELMSDYIGKLFGKNAEKNVSEVIKDLKSNGTAHYEFEGKFKNEQLRTIAGTSFMIEENSYATIAMDVTEEKKMEESLRSAHEHLMLMLETINGLTMNPLDYDTDGFDDNFLKVMDTVGPALNVDSIYIWKTKEADGKPGYTQIFEWSNSYKLQKWNTPLEYSENTGSASRVFVPFHLEWYYKLSTNQCINGIVRQFPDAQREHLQMQNIMSVIVIPVFLYNNFWGFVCFCDCRNERIFSLSEEAIFRTVSFIFANNMLRNEMTLRLMNATGDALAASRAKSTFLANMSHEIRTPMNAILGITDILMLQKGLSEDTEVGLDQIHNSCDMLLGIINDILDFSKIEAGKMDIMPAEYIVASLINDSVHLNMTRIAGKSIEFELQVDENIPAKLIGDALRIKQILNNILSNAFKYTEAGIITLSVDFQPNGDNISLIFSVKDTGRGMTREQMAKLFDEYSRFNTESNRIEGTGLGLAITQHLIRHLNGSIHVESEPGVGSLFVVRLPQKTVDQEILGKELAENLKQFRRNFVPDMEKSQITRDPMPYGKVLIVDDVETNLYVAIGLLKPYMLQIETVMRGRDAINKIKSGKKYDIVFMDHMMPEMDGIETTRLLRDLDYTNTIVALTANAVVGQADVFLQNGFDDFISKPIDIRHLNFILNKYIRDKQPLEVIEDAYRQISEIKTGDNKCLQSQMDSLLLGSFVRDARKAVSLLEEFEHSKTSRLSKLSDNNWFENEDNLRRFTVTVHGMKSSLGIIGEVKLSELAYKLEMDGRDRNFSFIEASTLEFLNELRVLLKNIETKRDEDTGYADEDIEGLHKKFLIIAELCSEYNRKGVLNIIAAIDVCSKETRSVLEEIKEYVIHSDFDDAERTAAAYIAKYSR